MRFARFLAEDIDLRAPWMSSWLLAAGFYNLIWGSAVILLPTLPSRLTGLAEPNYPAIWQCVGMIVGVYGVGYLIAARDPLRHWPIVLVGLLGKVLGPIGFVWAATRGELPWLFGATILSNDLLWWAPFSLILWHAARAATAPPASPQPLTLAEAIETVTTSNGETIATLSRSSPVLVVFVRHLGCTFCREALSDLSERWSRLRASGVQLVLVHMSPPAEVEAALAQHGLGNAVHISDPTCQLYRAFGLARGTFRQLFGLRVWRRGLRAAILDGHGVGSLKGDGFQMPGAFVVVDGRVRDSFIHRSAADRPDYLALAACPAPAAQAGLS